MKRLPSAECCPTDTTPRPVPPASVRGRAVKACRALGDPTRLEIFAVIAARPEAICVCDIVARFDLKQPTISHHLRVLRDAGLVSVSRRGTWAYYEVDPRGVHAARSALEAVLPEVLHADA